MRLLTITSLAFTLVACGGADPEPEELERSRLVLRALGPIAQQTYPHEQVTLKVIAFQTTVGGVDSQDDLSRAVGVGVVWQQLSGDGSVGLSAGVVATDVDGIAEVKVDTGDDDGHIQVSATAEGAEPVTFTISVRPDARVLTLTNGINMVVAMDKTEIIRARLARPAQNGEPGAPVSGAEIPVELIGGLRNGAGFEEGTGDSAVLISDGTGMVSLHFDTGSVPDLSYKLQFCGAGSCPGTPAVDLTLQVKRLLDSGGACVYFTDCSEGYVCQSGTCRPAAAYCDTDADCPSGFDCSDATRVCEEHQGGPCTSQAQCEAGEICGNGGYCIPDDGCLSNAQCPPGWTCNLASGLCLPPDNTPAIDVRGTWETKYHFDISETLGDFVMDDMAPIIDVLNLVFTDKLEIDVPIIGNILEAVIEALVAEYVKPWMKRVVQMLADIVHVFENVDVVGEMTLLQSPTTPVLGTVVTGEEQWNEVYLRVVSACYGGPQVFAEDPECGKINIKVQPEVYLDYSDNKLQIGALVHPFNGRVVGDQLLLEGRRADLEFRQFINAVLDVLVTYISTDGESGTPEYYTFKDFLLSAVPCQEIDEFIDSMMSDLTSGEITDISGIAYQCELDVAAAILKFEEFIGRQPVVLNLTFDQKARIKDDWNDEYADGFGDPEHPTDNAASSLAGGSDLHTIFGGDLDESSWWHGKRAWGGWDYEF